MVSEAVRMISQWQKASYETIAVICRDEEAAAGVSDRLKPQVTLRDFRAEGEEFGSGVMVLPIEYAKGLEFDAVLLYGVDEKNYPAEDGFARLLYVAATRALHELAVLYTGTLTDLIAAPVPEEKKQNDLTIRPKKTVRTIHERPVLTKQEEMRERSEQGRFELEFRDRIGPKKIMVQNPGEAKPVAKSRSVACLLYTSPSPRDTR